VLVEIVPDGLEALRQIQRLVGAATLPIILMSAEAASSEIARGLHLGAHDYIARPFDSSVARARIERQLALKQTLDERQQTIASLKSAHDLKDRFLYIATHDLKSPLSNIRLAQGLLRDVVGEDPTAADALDTIAETVDWMNTLVEDFLDTALLKNGGSQLNLEPVRLADAIQAAIAQYQGLAARKDITVATPHLEGFALADPARLMQIVGNLISNAIKYSPRHSSITITAETSGQLVRISVHDSGPGISLAERSRLFHAFSQLSAQPTAGESSSGLGLWIVKELVELHQGCVDVMCPPEGGSIFSVELPRCTPSLLPAQIAQN
jgi:signal transduction histidine kinase